MNPILQEFFSLAAPIVRGILQIAGKALAQELIDELQKLVDAHPSS